MIKRIFDILLSSFGLLISSPIWILLGLLILIEDGWPIFYLQERIGKYGESVNG
jgi:lipopolysaccharide/colanic/teichoic acid biosynthesis glycosyltransferase